MATKASVFIARLYDKTIYKTFAIMFLKTMLFYHLIVDVLEINIIYNR